nr:hypothetical protein CFP56_64814 [Quercus suber]
MPDPRLSLPFAQMTMLTFIPARAASKTNERSGVKAETDHTCFTTELGSKRSALRPVELVSIACLFGVDLLDAPRGNHQLWQTLLICGTAKIHIQYRVDLLPSSFVFMARDVLMYAGISQIMRLMGKLIRRSPHDQQAALSGPVSMTSTILTVVFNDRVISQGSFTSEGERKMLDRPSSPAHILRKDR